MDYKAMRDVGRAINAARSKTSRMDATQAEATRDIAGFLNGVNDNQRRDSQRAEAKRLLARARKAAKKLASTPMGKPLQSAVAHLQALAGMSEDAATLADVEGAIRERYVSTGDGRYYHEELGLIDGAVVEAAVSSDLIEHVLTSALDDSDELNEEDYEDDEEAVELMRIHVRPRPNPYPSPVAVQHDEHATFCILSNGMVVRERYHEGKQKRTFMGGMKTKGIVEKVRALASAARAIAGGGDKIMDINLVGESLDEDTQADYDRYFRRGWEEAKRLQSDDGTQALPAWRKLKGRRKIGDQDFVDGFRAYIDHRRGVYGVSTVRRAKRLGLSEDAPDEAEGEPLDGQIIAAMKRRARPASVADVYGMMDAPTRDTHAAMARLLKAGKLVRTATGGRTTYRLSEDVDEDGWDDSGRRIAQAQFDRLERERAAKAPAGNELMRSLSDLERRVVRIIAGYKSAGRQREYNRAGISADDVATAVKGLKAKKILRPNGAIDPKKNALVRAADEDEDDECDYGGLDESISRAQLESLERTLDRLFAAAGIDVEFTKHFMERVNDARNVRDITIEELAGLFRETWKQHRKTLEKAKPNWNAILQDLATDINIPIVMDVNRYGEVELVAKTVMRKKGFTGRAKRLRVKSESLDEGSKSLNVATVPLDKARAYAEAQFKKTGKSLDRVIPDFDKNYVALQQATKKALNIPRVQMPVIEPADMVTFEKRVKAGKLDIFKPWARGKLHVPTGLSKKAGEEWVELGWADGSKSDDKLSARVTSKAANTLLPTQSQIWLDKLVDNIIQFGMPTASSPIAKATIIVSKEGYIIDGHHRYGQAMLANPSLGLRALFVPLDIKTLLKVGRTYGEAIGNTVKEDDELGEMATELLPLKGELSRMVRYGGTFTVADARRYIADDKYVRFTPTDRQIASVLKYLGGRKKGAAFVFGDETDEGINDAYILKAVFMTGGAGAGKSFIAAKMFGGTGLKVVNSDEQLERAMKAAGLDLKRDIGSAEVQRPGGLRDRVKQLTGKRLDTYVQGRLGLIIDSTAAKVDKVQGQVKKLRALGYDCYMVFVNTTLETALARNEARPRTVPVKVATNDWEKVQENLRAYRQLFGAANFREVANDESLTPAQVTAQLVPTLWRAALPLLNRPVQNPVGKAWLDAQLNPVAEDRRAATSVYWNWIAPKIEEVVMLDRKAVQEKSEALGLNARAVNGAVTSAIATVMEGWPYANHRAAIVAAERALSSATPGLSEDAGLLGMLASYVVGKAGEARKKSSYSLTGEGVEEGWLDEGTYDFSATVPAADAKRLMQIVGAYAESHMVGSAGAAKGKFTVNGTLTDTKGRRGNFIDAVQLYKLGGTIKVGGKRVNECLDETMFPMPHSELQTSAAYRFAPGSKRPTMVKNLGWLMRNWQSIRSFTVEKPEGGASMVDAVLIAHLDNGAMYTETFASKAVLKGWLNRPVFKGLPVHWFGTHQTVGESEDWTIELGFTDAIEESGDDLCEQEIERVDCAVDEVVSPLQKDTAKLLKRFFASKGLKVGIRSSSTKSDYMDVRLTQFGGFPVEMRRDALRAIYGDSFKIGEQAVAGNVMTGRMSLGATQWRDFLQAQGVKVPAHVAERVDEAQRTTFDKVILGILRGAKKPMTLRDLTVAVALESESPMYIDKRVIERAIFDLADRGKIARGARGFSVAESAHPDNALPESQPILDEAVRVKGDWVPGGITVHGRKHTVSVDVAGKGPAQMVFEVEGREYRFLGVERIVPASANESVRREHVGPSAVSRAAWLKVFKEDSRRRRAYESGDMDLDEFTSAGVPSMGARRVVVDLEDIYGEDDTEDDEPGLDEDAANAHGVVFDEFALRAMWEEEDEDTRGTFAEWRETHFTEIAEDEWVEDEPILDEAAKAPPGAKVHKGIYYFHLRRDAQLWAEENGWPTDRINDFTRGFAVQSGKSGNYAGPGEKPRQWKGTHPLREDVEDGRGRTFTEAELATLWKAKSPDYDIEYDDWRALHFTEVSEGEYDLDEDMLDTLDEAETACALDEDELDEVSPPGFKGTVKAMKRKHPEIDNPYALAWAMFKKGAKSNYKADGTRKDEGDIDEASDPVAAMRKVLIQNPGQSFNIKQLAMATDLSELAARKAVNELVIAGTAKFKRGDGYSLAGDGMAITPQDRRAGRRMRITNQRTSDRSGRDYFGEKRRKRMYGIDPEESVDETTRSGNVGGYARDALGADHFARGDGGGNGPVNYEHVLVTHPENKGREGGIRDAGPGKKGKRAKFAGPGGIQSEPGLNVAMRAAIEAVRVTPGVTAAADEAAITAGEPIYVLVAMDEVEEVKVVFVEESKLEEYDEQETDWVCAYATNEGEVEETRVSADDQTIEVSYDGRRKKYVVHDELYNESLYDDIASAHGAALARAIDGGYLLVVQSVKPGDTVPDATVAEGVSVGGSNQNTEGLIEVQFEENELERFVLAAQTAGADSAVPIDYDRGAFHTRLPAPIATRVRELMAV